MPDNKWFVIVYVAVAILLPRIPVVGKFFNVINTGIHEFGHALMALLLDGQVDKIELFRDTSGTTTTKTGGRFSAALVSLAGYPFSATVAYGSLYLIANGASGALLAALTVIFAVMLLFWIRNAYGLLWVLLFCGLNVFLLCLGKQEMTGVAAFFYAVMMMTESVISSVALVVLSFRNSVKAGDATNLAKLTCVPAPVWGLLFLAYSLWVAYRSVLLCL